MPTNPLPRWRGFNLLNFFTMASTGDVAEDDFRWIADWGFDFVRFPMCYTLWTEDGDPYRLNERMLAKIDRAVELGRCYNLHVSLNFHRAPGYSVNRERDEPYDLWHDQDALDAFCFQWTSFAARYRGMSSDLVSFDLVNEPPAAEDTGMTRADHARVISAAVAAIRGVDPDRRIIADGISWGNEPCPELAELGIGQSCRAYLPMGVSHYKATWAGYDFPEPCWPNGDHYGEVWDLPRLEAHYARWAALLEQGVGVHCGEGGAFCHTPHPMALHWFGDVLTILEGLGIGWALWNFRGAFGILDSGRQDVAYAEWHGHALDRELLALLQRH
jgi:endoglucanase